LANVDESDRPDRAGVPAGRQPTTTFSVLRSAATSFGFAEPRRCLIAPIHDFP